MHDIADDAKTIQSNLDPPFAADEPDAILRAARWQDLGNDDPRFPAACVIEFSTTAFTLSAFKRHEVALPAPIQKAVPKRQAEFLMGRVAARRAIERLGVAASTPGIGTSREPLWQASVVGSITHTGEMAGAVAVMSATVKGIGIDIENIIQPDACDAIRGFVITPSEQALLEAQCEHLSAEMLLTIAFSAKESFFKGTFATVGRYFEFNAARVSCLNVKSGRLTLTLAETLCTTLLKDHSFTVCFRALSATTVATSFIW